VERRFRFGVQASSAINRSAWVELARRVEAHGYSTLTMPDHFTDQLAPVPALMCAADATSELRVGALVFDNDYKHPVVLAKEMATIDLLSDGRLEIGIGAGWMRSDYDATGMPFDSAPVRIARLAEALAVLKGYLSEGRVDLAGTHYSVRDLDGRPKPVQRPHPPILIGGSGRRVLSLAAREADIIGINGRFPTGTGAQDRLNSIRADAVDERVGWVRSEAAERFPTIEMNVRPFYVAVTPDRSTLVEGLAAGLGFEPAELRETPFALIGTAEEIAEDLRARRERWGFSYIIVGPEDVDAFAPVVDLLRGT
jgi:probable F420-dependent oxidoreductase